MPEWEGNVFINKFLSSENNKSFFQKFTSSWVNLPLLQVDRFHRAPNSNSSCYGTVSANRQENNINNKLTSFFSMLIDLLDSLELSGLVIAKPKSDEAVTRWCNIDGCENSTEQGCITYLSFHSPVTIETSHWWPFYRVVAVYFDMY